MKPLAFCLYAWVGMWFAAIFAFHLIFFAFGLVFLISALGLIVKEESEAKEWKE